MANYLDSLERLADLFQKGVLSKEEFEREKARILSDVGPPEVAGHERLTFNRKYLQWAGIGLAVIFVGTLVGLLVRGDLAGSKANDETRTQIARRDEKPKDAIQGTIQFTDLERCAPTPAFAGLLGRLREAVGQGEDATSEVYLAGAKAPFTINTESLTVDGGVTKVASLQIVRDWNGLSTSKVRTIDWEQGSAIYIAFTDRVEALSEALKSKGVDARPGRIVTFGDTMILAEALPEGGSGLTCALVRDGSVDEKEEVESDF